MSSYLDNVNNQLNGLKVERDSNVENKLRILNTNLNSLYLGKSQEQQWKELFQKAKEIRQNNDLIASLNKLSVNGLSVGK